jgi:6-pyruvoyltetrahydropterin/6-carboxytetrahydropterin synthase
MTKLTRTYRFSASHRLHSDRLTSEQNEQLYGKCNNPFGHGHDYALRITVRGGIDQRTGRVVEPGRLDRYVRERVIDVFDHRDINEDVPGFQGVPTTENLALDVAARLRERWGEWFPGVELHAVSIRETPRNTIELRI